MGSQSWTRLKRLSTHTHVSRSNESETERGAAPTCARPQPFLNQPTIHSFIRCVSSGTQHTVNTLQTVYSLQSYLQAETGHNTKVHLPYHYLGSLAPHPKHPILASQSLKFKAFFFKKKTSPSLVAQMVPRLPAKRETLVRSLGQEGSPREGNGNPLQHPCLENPMDGGAW